MIKLNIYQKSDLGVIKSLPWCGGSTTIHKDEFGNELYYTVFVKPTNIMQRIITKYVINNLECTFEEEIKAA